MIVLRSTTDFWPINSLNTCWDNDDSGLTHCYEALSFNKLGFNCNIFLVHRYSHKITGGFANLEWQHATCTIVVEVTLRTSAAANCCWKYNQTPIRQQLNILPLEDFISSFADLFEGSKRVWSKRNTKSGHKTQVNFYCICGDGQ